MDIFGKILGQFIDIIEWLDNSNDTLVYRFPRQGNEIKTGAKLVVRPGQLAVFVNEGQVQQASSETNKGIADAFGPGTYELTTKNLPILTTLQGWKYGFNSPFKAEVYFFSTRIFTGQKWGTPNPIMLRDPELGPVRLRAFGSYALRIVDPRKMLEQLVGTDGRFEIEEVDEQLRALLVSRFAAWAGKSNMSVFDFAANYPQMGESLKEALHKDFDDYGLGLEAVLIENVTLPEEVEKALDKRTQMGVIGDLGKYTQFQAANALEASANNPSGAGAAAFLNAGVGLAVGQQMAQNLQPQSQAPVAPPPLPNAAQWFVGIGGQQQGPFDAVMLANMAQSGQLTRDTLVWKNGMAGWVAAGTVGEIASIFAQVPPPLPQ
ncbi:MAG: SPFH domain-containing protein [Deinococcales bacterium]